MYPVRLCTSHRVGCLHTLSIAVLDEPTVFWSVRHSFYESFSRMQDFTAKSWWNLPAADFPVIHTAGDRFSSFSICSACCFCCRGEKRFVDSGEGYFRSGNNHKLIENELLHAHFASILAEVNSIHCVFSERSAPEIAKFDPNLFLLPVWYFHYTGRMTVLNKGNVRACVRK